MMRLSDPTLGYENTLTTCISGIGTNAFKVKMEAEKEALIKAGDDYIEAGKKGALSSIPPTDKAIIDPVVIGTLSKSELVNLYNYYLRSKEKEEARKIYSKLLNAAGDDCPFCGGIGKPRNLDHFLPKSRFPQFSILPQNLIPSCLDCNLGEKGEAFATKSDDQIIHPYVDDDRFFKEQWIHAKCEIDANNRPSSITYFVEAPNEWDLVHKNRVQKHFEDFGLAENYSLKASEHLQIQVGTISVLRGENVPDKIIRSAVIDQGVNKAPYINHWIRGMYQALSLYLG